MNSNPDILLQQLNSILPAKISQIKKGHGSFLTIDLMTQSGSTDIHLWLYLCDWKICKSKRTLLKSQNNLNDAQFNKAIKEIVGLNLRHIPAVKNEKLFEFHCDGDLKIVLMEND